MTHRHTSLRTHSVLRRCLLGTGIVAAVLPALAMADLPIETVESTTSKIEWTRLPAINAPFELTSSRKFCIRDDSALQPGQPARGPASGGVRLSSINPENPNVVLGRFADPSATGWTVIDEEVFVMKAGQVLVCDPKTLSQQKVIQLGTVVVPANGRPQTVKRVPGGWYCDGYVFDETGTKIRRAFFFRSAQINQTTEFTAAQRNLAGMEFSLSTSSRVQSQSRIALETVPAYLNLRNLSSTQQQLFLSDPGRRRDINPIFSLPSGGEPITGTTRHVRVNGSDFSFSCDTASLHGRILSFDATTAGLASPRRFLFDQPVWTLDGFQKDKSEYRFLDGNRSHPVVETSVIHQRVRRGRSDVRARLENQVRSFLQRQFTRPQTFEELRRKLEQYRQRVTREFERTVGRSPAGIPIPHRVRARMSWIDFPVGYEYSVWSEWPIEVLLTRYDPRLMQVDSARQEAIRRQREQQRQQQIAERKRREEMRKRIAEEQQKKAEAAAERVAEEKRAAFLQEHLNRSTTTRVIVAGVLGLLSIAGIIGLAMTGKADSQEASS